MSKITKEQIKELRDIHREHAPKQYLVYGNADTTIFVNAARVALPECLDEIERLAGDLDRAVEALDYIDKNWEHSHSGRLVGEEKCPGCITQKALDKIKELVGGDDE